MLRTMEGKRAMEGTILRYELRNTQSRFFDGLPSVALDCLNFWLPAALRAMEGTILRYELRVLSPERRMVEAAGIEPASEIHSRITSTSLAFYLLSHLNRRLKAGFD